MRTAVTHAPDVTGMVAARFVGANTDVDRDASRAKACVTLPRYCGVGVLDRRDDPCQARSDNGVGAGWRLAVVRARLQRYVQGATARRLAAAAQRLDLGVRPAAGLRPAATDNDAVFHDHGAHGRIRPCPAEPAPAEI